jgi:glycosyltransferase involved in cell wall biosynthesis
MLERAQSRIFRWALEASDAVVALTPSRQQRLEQEARISYSCVIPNAPDLAVPLARRRSARTPVVLFLGHLYREKGVYDLLEAFATVRRTHPDLRLVFAGEGREAKPLRSHAERLGLGEVVQLPGWVDPDEKANLLAEAACLVLPSHTEGLPLALLEAMHAGVPIIATPVGGVPDVVEDGVGALLVPPHDARALSDALMRVLDDAELANRLSEGARRRALAEYTPEALATRIRDVYREVLGSR